MSAQKIFITGASSGIGSGLALNYSAPGVTLGLAARREDRLKKLAQECEARGAQVFIYQLDVVDVKACEQAANRFIKEAGGIDVVIANAGVGGWRHPRDTSAEDLTRIIETNVSGVINIVMAFVPTLINQKRGQIVATSSIAAFAASPRGSYSASKIAVRYLMNSWRIDLEPYGISCTTLYPGFIETEMTNRPDARYPFYTTADKAAAAFRSAIEQRKKNYIYPWQWRWLVPFAGLIPDWAWRRSLPWDE